jgi:pimeloyl-ACP methyl ester carboxylesterase
MKLFFRKMGIGAPLLILHGLFGISDNWLSIAKKLAQDYCVYIIDMRNHGRSPHSESFNYSVMVDDIYEFLTDFNLRRINLLGHSMGGLAAINFCMEYPHRINSLIVIDIAPKAYPVIHQSIIDGLFSLDLRKLKSRQEADTHLAQFVESPRVRKFLLKNLYRDDNQNFAWRLNLAVIAQNLNEIGKGLIKKITIEKPVLFIRGGASDYIADEDIGRISKLFPSSEIHTISGASHWIHSDAPNALLTIIRSFLIEHQM